MVNTGKFLDGKELSYKILEDGYNIYLGGRLWISQPKPYDKNFVPNGSYEENALAQIETLIPNEDQTE